MSRKKFIRDLYFVNGKTITEIADDTGHDRKTVRKIIHTDDWNEPTPVRPERLTPKLEPYKAIVDEWLIEDKRAKKKQRHTARRVYDRLKAEDGINGTFDCSYETVNAYVQTRKKEIFGEAREGSIPLEHKPGESQADFGAADYYENGTLHEGNHFNISFPHSNQGFAQLFPGENAECLLEGLENIFRHIGGVPPEIWFDNASSMVVSILAGGERKLTEKFLRFAEHYGFTAIFCNPDAGNEKGSVEGKVGYHRRNMLVPIPRFENLIEYNKYLLSLADADAKRGHYIKEARIEDIFKEDKAALMPLPKNEFDTARYIVCKADNFGFIRLNEGKHEYSAAPKYAGMAVTVKLTSDAVTILDESGRPITAHKRLYGEKKSRQMNWIPYLEQLSRRPRAVKYSGIYSILPDVVREYIERSKGGDTSNIIKMLAELTKRTDFESATATVAQAISHNALDADSLMALHRRLFMDMPELPPLNSPDFPHMDPLLPNLTDYDMVIGRRN